MLRNYKKWNFKIHLKYSRFYKHYYLFVNFTENASILPLLHRLRIKLILLDRLHCSFFIGLYWGCSKMNFGFGGFSCWFVFNYSRFLLLSLFFFCFVFKFVFIIFFYFYLSFQKKCHQVNIILLFSCFFFFLYYFFFIKKERKKICKKK